MKIKVPEYFTRFRCIGGDCKNSCCVGWELYIDNGTAEKYRSLGGRLGEKAREYLSLTEDGYVLRACEGGRCPFLNNEGLCELIAEHGDEMISEVCREHPRYYNQYGGYYEGGIALACEEGARLIFSADMPVRFVEVEKDTEVGDEDTPRCLEYALKLREGIFNILSDRSVNPTLVLCRLLSVADIVDNDTFDMEFKGIMNISPPDLRPCESDSPDKLLCELPDYIDALLQAEPLTDRWHPSLWSALCCIHNDRQSLTCYLWSNEAALRALAFYYAHRYLVDGIYDLTVRERVRLTALTPAVILAVCYALGERSEGIIYESSAFSRELEYSEENMESILSLL